jgi:DNA-binding response OmpR family regulator
MKNSKVAVISENPELSRFFELELTVRGYCVSLFSDISGINEEYDFLLVDIDTVDAPLGVYTCPVICVSSKENREDLSYFLSWPCAFSDIDRICEALCNSKESADASASNSNILYVLDREKGRVLIENIHISLSGTELMIIEELCKSFGQTVKRESIMSLIGAVDGNIADVYICRLRKKIEGPLNKKLIFTKRGKGYLTTLKIIQA